MLRRVGAPRAPRFRPLEKAGHSRPRAIDCLSTAKQSDVGRGESSVSRRARSAMYCAVHSPMPRMLRNFAIASSMVPKGRKRFGSAETAWASSFNEARRAAGIPTSMSFARARVRASGNTWVRRGSLANSRATVRAVFRHQLFGKFPSGRYANLLAQDRAHRQFEAVPAAGSAQSRPLRHKRRQTWIERQMSVDGLDVGAQIEQTPHSRDDRRDRLHAWKANGDAEALLFRQMAHLEATSESIHPHSAQIAAVLDHLHAGNSACLQISKHGLPIVGWAVTQTQRDAAGALRKIRGVLAAQFRGRPAEELQENFVESANAAETGRERDFRHRHRGLMDQLFGEQHAPRLRHRHRRCAKMLHEESPQMTFADSQPLGERFHAAVFAIQCTVGNQCQSARNRVRRAAPRRHFRRGLRPAAQTRAVPVLLRGGGRPEKTAVLKLRGPRRTNRAAIHARRRHPDEYQSIETRIPAAQRAITDLPIRQFHKHIFSRLDHSNSRFSDLLMGAQFCE